MVYVTIVLAFLVAIRNLLLVDMALRSPAYFDTWHIDLSKLLIS